MRAGPPRRRPIALVASVLAAVIALAGCGSPPGTVSGDDGAGMRSFAADNGVIRIPQRPQRVVALAAAVEQTLRLGVTPVGNSTPLEERSMLRRLTPEQVAAYRSATNVGAGSQLNYEKIASLRPDLIVINAPRYALRVYDFDRLQAIAPTVFVSIDIPTWRTIEERLADAVARTDVVARQRMTYDETVARIRRESGAFVTSRSFAFVNQWTSGKQDTFVREYANSYCTAYAGDTGMSITAPPPRLTRGATFETLSLELLSGLGSFDVVIYPLDPDGTTKDEFQPVLDSTVWKATPQVADRAVGVRCSENLSYADGTDNLESLAAALTRLRATR